MKPFVVMLTTDFNVDRRILQEADALKQDGWNVKIIAMPNKKEESNDIINDIIRIKTDNQGFNSIYVIIFGFYRFVLRYLPFLNKQLLKNLEWKVEAFPFVIH